MITDFNAEEYVLVLAQFLNDYNAVDLIHEDTCYKSINNLSCVDLIITNISNSFQNTSTFRKCLSDFHKRVVRLSSKMFQKKST